MSDLCQERQSPGQEFNPRPPEYEGVVLTTRLCCSVFGFNYITITCHSRNLCILT